MGPRVGFGLTRLGFGRMLKKGCERYSGERDDDIRNMFRTSWFDRKILFLPIQCTHISEIWPSEQLEGFKLILIMSTATTTTPNLRVRKKKVLRTRGLQIAIRINVAV